MVKATKNNKVGSNTDFSNSVSTTIDPELSTIALTIDMMIPTPEYTEKDLVRIQAIIKKTPMPLDGVGNNVDRLDMAYEDHIGGACEYYFSGAVTQ